MSENNKKEMSVQEYLEQERVREETDRKLNNKKQNVISKLIDKIVDKSNSRPLHKVNKKVYIILALLGSELGLHRFYEKRYILGILYSLPIILGLIFNTILKLDFNFYTFVGFPVAMMVVDLMIVIPKPADENGMVEL